MMWELEAERWRAFMRTGLIAALVAAWCGYALRVPASYGSKALKAALLKKVPAKPGAAQIEASAGTAGPAIQSYIEAARKRGDLDKAVAPNGMTYAQILRRAQDISDEVNSRPNDLGLQPEDRRPGDDDPAVVVPQLLEMLRSTHADVRSEGAMMMLDNRWAKSERALEAVPVLEGMVRSSEDGAQFAEIALKRIRFWETKRRYSTAKP
jgi:hypothetical protein